MEGAVGARAEAEFRAFSRALQCVDAEVRQFAQSLSEHAEKRAVLILGATGSGKSTLLNLLAGHRHAYANASFIFEGEAVERWDITAEGGAARTAAGPVSATATPNFHRRGDVLLVDCPGFGDSRGWSRALANHMLIDALFHHFAALQIVFVECVANLTENRGNVLFDDLRCLLGLFEPAGLQRLARCLSLVFSKGRRLSFAPLLLELLRARGAAGLLAPAQLQLYEELFRGLDARGALLSFGTPPEQPQHQPAFFEEARCALEQCIEGGAFERLRPAVVLPDTSTRLKLAEMKAAARLHLDCIWLDLLVFLRKAARGWSAEAALVALRLAAFADWCCGALLNTDNALGLVDAARICGLREKYAATLPEDHQVIARVAVGLWQLSLAFAAFRKAGTPVEGWEKAQMFAGRREAVLALRARIAARLKSYWLLGRGPAAVGAGAVGTGALGAAGLLEGATALAVGCLALPLAALGAGSFYVAARRREVERLIAEVTPESLFD